MHQGRECQVAGKSFMKFAFRAKQGCETRDLVASFLFPWCIYNFSSCKDEKNVLEFLIAGDKYIFLTSGEKKE